MDRDDNNKLERGRKDLDYVTYNQAKELIEKMINQSFKDRFRSIGIDTEDYKETKNMYEDLVFLRESRVAANEKKSTFAKSVVTAIVGSIFGVATTAIGWLITSHK